MFTLVSEPRAATILYNFLVANARPGYFYLPANICPELLFVFARALVPFVLVDIDSTTLCLDSGFVLDKAQENPGQCAGILYVRTYGVLQSEPDSDASEFFKSLKAIDPEALVIDDRCLCAPDFDTPPSADIDLTLYSTGSKKFVDVGSGGFAKLGPGMVYERLGYSSTKRSFDPKAEARMHAQIHHDLDAGVFFDPGPCINVDWLVLSDGDAPAFTRDRYSARVAVALHAAVLRKAELNAIYEELIPEAAQLEEAFNQWRFNINVSHKAELLSSLFAAGLFASNHYASLAPVWPGSAPTPNADKLKSCVVNLFNDGYYSPEQAQKTAQLVAAHVAKYDALKTP